MLDRNEQDLLNDLVELCEHYDASLEIKSVVVNQESKGHLGDIEVDETGVSREGVTLL